MRKRACLTTEETHRNSDVKDAGGRSFAGGLGMPSKPVSADFSSFSLSSSTGSGLLFLDFEKKPFLALGESWTDGFCSTSAFSLVGASECATDAAMSATLTSLGELGVVGDGDREIIKK